MLVYSQCVSAFHTESFVLQLSLPSAPSFTSGEHIPFVLSLVFPQAPALPTLLTPNINIELIKRTRINRLGGLEIAMREATIGRADIRNIKETVAGITHLSGVMQAGKPGRESSWKVYAMADVQVSHYKQCPQRLGLMDMIIVCGSDHYSPAEIYDMQCTQLEA
jgi:hypothetical protein